MTVRKILGKVDHKYGNHAVAKLECGRYAVGNIRVGRHAKNADVFNDFDQAFDHWVKVLRKIPADELHIAN